MRTLLVTLHSKFVHASLALPSLAAYCAAGDCGTVDIREFTVHEPKEQVLAAILREAPDVVAFSVYIWNRRESLELADALSVAAPGMRVILGGPEVIAADGQLFAEHPGLAAVVRGEGEEPLRALLEAWGQGREPAAPPARTLLRRGGEVVAGADAPPLADLDRIPSPIRSGLVDLRRGLVYLETSRGCPYRCAFCMSARDAGVRSYSRERIEADLAALIDAGVPTVKLVDRTFNYDGARARQIWRFILRRNRVSTFHFEIGAHLLEEDDLQLLEGVPPGVFQFEIGVQSTLPATLAAIERRTDLDRLCANVRRLRRSGNIRLHLDLICGLPQEGYADFLDSLDRVLALEPHHLQIEPVKLLPGAPLRDAAAATGIRFDPHPPYTVLATPWLDFAALERLRGIGRLLDLTWNAGRARGFLEGLRRGGSWSGALETLEGYWRRRDLFRHPLGQRELFEALADFVVSTLPATEQRRCLDLLARDYALLERVVPERAPSFFDLSLSADEAAEVRRRVRGATDAVRGEGIKLQHFAAVFRGLPGEGGRTVRLFLYLSASGKGVTVREEILPAATFAP